MTASEENVTTSAEPKMIEVQTIQPGPDGFHPRPAARRRTAILVAASRARLSRCPDLLRHPFPGGGRNRG